MSELCRKCAREELLKEKPDAMIPMNAIPHTCDKRLENPFFLLAFAQYLDGTDGMCAVCNHLYENVKDAVLHDIVCVSSDPPRVACRKCFDNDANYQKLLKLKNEYHDGE